MVWNCSTVNTLKETSLHRTVPRHRTNGKPIHSYAEQLYTEPFQSSRVNAAYVHSVCTSRCEINALAPRGLFSGFFHGPIRGGL